MRICPLRRKRKIGEREAEEEEESRGGKDEREFGNALYLPEEVAHGEVEVEVEVEDGEAENSPGLRSVRLGVSEQNGQKARETPRRTARPRTVLKKAGNLKMRRCESAYARTSATC